MDAFVFLLVCLTILVVMVGRVYRKPSTEAEPAPDTRSERLVALLDPDISEALARVALSVGVSEIDLANRLLRASIRDEEGNPR